MAYLLDANVLIYAAHTDFSHHEVCLDWLTGTLTRGDTVYTTELTEIALLRITTLPSLKERAAKVSDVFAFLSDLHQLTNYQLLTQSALTINRWKALCMRYALRGNHINDAYLAALALEHKATLVSADKGFARFTELSWFNPVAE